jgi:hypothetical protein
MFDLSTTIIPGGLSLTDLLVQFDNVMIACGMTVYDSYTSGGNTIRVYQLIQNGTATGTVYLQYTFTTASSATYFSPSLNTYQTWNTGTHTGTNSTSPTAGITLYPTNPISVYIFQSDSGEGKFAIFTNGGTTNVAGVVGWVRPATKHASYNEATFAFYFLANSANMTSFATARSAVAATVQFNTFLSTAPISADSYIRPYAPGCKVLYFNGSAGGVYGRFSEDWADVGSSSNSFGYILQDASDASQRYFCISTTTAVRIR